MVSDRYQVVQNKEAFAFTDVLLGECVRYETAGSLQGGKRVFILAKFPQRFIIAGDEIMPYFVIMNSHDAGCSIKAAMTPIRCLLKSIQRFMTGMVIWKWLTACLPLTGEAEC